MSNRAVFQRCCYTRRFRRISPASKAAAASPPTSTKGVRFRTGDSSVDAGSGARAALRGELVSVASTLDVVGYDSPLVTGRVESEPRRLEDRVVGVRFDPAVIGVRTEVVVVAWATDVVVVGLGRSGGGWFGGPGPVTVSGPDSLKNTWSWRTQLLEIT